VDDPSVPELDDAAAAEPTAGDEELQEDTGSGASGEEPTAPQEDVEDGDGGEQPDASQENVEPEDGDGGEEPEPAATQEDIEDDLSGDGMLISGGQHQDGEGCDEDGVEGQTGSHHSD
jgi:hypothetical protein